MKFKLWIDVRVLSLVGVVSVSLNIVLLVLSSLRKEQIYTHRKIIQPSQDLRNSFCASCYVFGTSRDNVSANGNLAMLSLQNESLCCVGEAESLITLVNIMVMRSYTNRTMLDHLEHVPSAHLYLDTLTDHEYTWSEEFGFGAGHVSKNLEFRNGRFCIKTSGLYNIYSFITFKQEQTSASSSEINHSVRKLRPLSDDFRSLPILEATMKLPATGQSFKTSYLSGIVSLEASDELYVDVSHINLIYRYAPANFIGLHLLESRSKD